MQTATTIAAEYMLARSLIFREAGGVKETYHFDWIGSARALTDGAQTVLATQNFDAFGVSVGSTGSSGNTYKFDGEWRYRDDGDFGLLHVGARYYEPGTGRWNSSDPVRGDEAVPQTLHLYAYVQNDPGNLTDPRGLFALTCIDHCKNACTTFFDSIMCKVCCVVVPGAGSGCMVFWCTSWIDVE